MVQGADALPQADCVRLCLHAGHDPGRHCAGQLAHHTVPRQADPVAGSPGRHRARHRDDGAAVVRGAAVHDRPGTDAAPLAVVRDERVARLPDRRQRARDLSDGVALGIAFPIGLRLWTRGGAHEDEERLAERIGVFYSLNVDRVDLRVPRRRLPSASTPRQPCVAGGAGVGELRGRSRSPGRVRVVTCDPRDRRRGVFGRVRAGTRRLRGSVRSVPGAAVQGTATAVERGGRRSDGSRARRAQRRDLAQRERQPPGQHRSRDGAHAPQYRPSADDAASGCSGSARHRVRGRRDGRRRQHPRGRGRRRRGARRRRGSWSRVSRIVNYGVLGRPNVHLRIDDGRNHLLVTKRRYDVVTADVILPIYAGSGNLYSAEYFRLIRGVLKPGGLVLQWVAGTEAEYKTIVRTFVSVFPEATAWMDGTLLVGSVEPLQLRRSEFERKLRCRASAQGARDLGTETFEQLLKLYRAGPGRAPRVRGFGAHPHRQPADRRVLPEPSARSRPRSRAHRHRRRPPSRRRKLEQIRVRRRGMSCLPAVTGSPPSLA